MVKKSGLGKGLGKGLDTLIPAGTGIKSTPKTKQEVVVEKVIKKEEVMVKLTEIEPNREQPRKNFDEDSLLELGRIHQTVWSHSAADRSKKRRIL